jgi:hypothetical protein
MTLPAATPVTAPEVAFTVAVVGVALLHVPPAVAFDNVNVAVTQAFVVPVILATVGTSIIEIEVVTIEVQPKTVLEKDIVEEPTETHVTRPDELMVATLALLLVQVPPTDVSDNVKVLATQPELAPVMAPKVGNGLIVNA